MAINKPKSKPSGTDSVSKKQSFQEWAMAGGGVPLQYKGREHVWDRKVKQYAEGGDVHMQVGGISKLLKAAKTAKEAPAVVVPSRLSEFQAEVAQKSGQYGAKRLQRAADEVKNIERLYKPEALRELFLGDNAKALVTMNPADFEKFAKKLEERTRADIGPKAAELAKRGQIDKYTVPTDEYIQHLMRVQGGFDEVPYLTLYKDETGLPMFPNVRGHEGRHRSRALAEMGEPSSLVNIYPSGGLREELPRRSREEFIEALRKELDLKDRMVIGEDNINVLRLPDIYAEGGEVGMQAGGISRLLKSLKGTQEVLPAAQREANLQKMLAESKTPMRLYHGTTATEGGKGAEAIRNIRPSKEGSLGSGTYLTPKAAQASGYSGIPNDEAISLMAGHPSAKSMADQFMADRASGTIREGQVGGNMLPVYAQIKNPLIIDGTGDPMIEALIKLGMDEGKASRMVERAYDQKGYIGKEVQQRAQAQGYDGLMQYRGGDLAEVVTYKPGQIKSAIGNRGTYDTTKAELNEAGGGLIKALKGVKGTQKVLPAAERDANLEKMLEDSAIKERLYHGTGADISEFKPSVIGAMGPGTYLTKNPKEASEYANVISHKRATNQPNVLPVHAQVKNPFEISRVNRSGSELFNRFDPGGKLTDDEVIELVKKAGYDAIHALEEGTINILDPRKIKSAIGNRGTYDMTDPDLNKAGGGLMKALKNLKGTQKVLPAAESDENLQKFLGNSRIRERLYHATPKNFKEFKPGGNDPTLSGPAIWLTPDAKKQPAAHNIGGGSRGFVEGTNVMPVYAQARSPLMLDDRLSIEWAREVFADGSREFPDLISPKTVEELKKSGYDSIIHADPFGNRGGEQEIIMFDPNRIKSAIGNRGTYDIEEADITKAAGGDIHMQVGGVARFLKGVKGPQDEALRLAQQRAALPPSKGGLGLPPDNTPEQRAKAMGFKTSKPVFHGSAKPLERFDNSMLGSNTGANDALIGHHFAGDRSDADLYATMAAEKLQKSQTGDGYGATGHIGEYLIRSKNPLVVDDLDSPLLDKIEAFNYAKQNKNDSIIFPYGTDVDSAYTQVVFDPDNIRLRNAAFDPFRKDVATAAAMGVAAPNLLAKEKKKAHGGDVHMDTGGAAFGVFPQMKGKRSKQDPEAAKNVPVDLARGFVSGVLGAPGDIESFARLPYELITGKESPTFLPTSEDIEKRLPFRSEAPVSRAASGAGQLAGGFYMGPGSPLRAVGALPGAIKHGAKEFAKASAAAAPRLTVYHGSPHKFEKFDASKIGTGEGAQAYGHGLYLAESPDVAKGYRNKLNDPIIDSVKADLYEIAGDPQWSVQAFDANGKLIPKAKGYLAPDEIAKHYGDEVANMVLSSKYGGHFKDLGIQEGALYKVDLPDEKIARMLDWDKPLGQQPEVIKALKGTDYEVGMSQREAEKIADMRLRQEADEWAEMTGGDPVDYSNNVDWEKYVDQVRKESGSIDSSITGKDLHRMVMRDEGYRPDLFDPENYQVGTSEALRGYGIPGIRYLDASSRDAGKGTSNFVVFPGEEDALTILERKKEGGEVKMAGGGKMGVGKEAVEGLVSGIKRMLKPKAADAVPASGAAPAVAPMTKVLPVGASIKMTKGLPVGMGIKDVSGLTKSETFGKKLPGLKTEEAYMGTGIPINVRSNPEVSNMKFYVDDSGQANLEINPVFANDMSYVKNRHFRAVDDFLWPHGEDVYVRGANTKDDFDYLKSKTHRGSKNWATNEQEGGLSVGRGVEATMFPYSYLVKGKRIGSGSDSEPLLDLASAEPVGKLMTQKQMQAFLKKANEKKLASLGIEDYQMRALRSVPLLKKIETESAAPTATTAATAAASGLAAPDLLAEEQKKAGGPVNMAGGGAAFGIYPKQRATPSSEETKKAVKQASQVGVDLLLPQDAVDVGMMLVPGGKIARKAGAALIAGGASTDTEAGVMKEVLKKLLKPGADTAAQEVTAAERAAAGRKAAELIKSQPPVKASEALGQAMEKGFKKTTTTQADRTRVGGGNIGGAPFSAISEVDPAYAGKVWGVMDEGTAARLKNLTDPETAWTTMLGSANQLKTNPIVFEKLKKGFLESMKAGNLKPELEAKINHNLALTFGDGASIRDPGIWKQADTFEKRAALADLMMGQGIAPGKGGKSLGGEKSGKGVIFKPTDILKRETEPGLLHPEHGGIAPTFAAGPRLFSMDPVSEFRPDLHPGFPTLISGKDLGYNMIPTPTEVYLPEWHSRFKKANPDRKGPGYYDLALGVKGEGLPSQELNNPYIRHLIREGFKDGGSVSGLSTVNKLCGCHD